jgi:hypothetical protein
MTGNFAVESWHSLLWNRGPSCRGIVAQVGVESVAGLPWNTQFANIEDFLVLISAEDREKYQLFYCLGFLNWHIKGDKVQAQKDFNTFLARGSPETYKKERELAIAWVSDLARG